MLAIAVIPAAVTDGRERIASSGTAGLTDSSWRIRRPLAIGVLGALVSSGRVRDSWDRMTRGLSIRMALQWSRHRYLQRNAAMLCERLVCTTGNTLQASLMDSRKMT